VKIAECDYGYVTCFYSFVCHSTVEAMERSPLDVADHSALCFPTLCVGDVIFTPTVADPF